MPKRSSKPDAFQNALRVVEEAIGGQLKKNPAAVALGRAWGASREAKQGQIT